LQHPYVKRAPVPTNSQQALIDQRAKIQKLTLTVNQLSQQIKAAQQQTQSKQARQAQMQQISGQWLTLCNRLNTASDELDIDNLKLMQRLQKAETAELQNINALAKRYRNTQASIEKLKTLIARSEASLEQLQERTRKLEAEWQGRPQEQIDIEAALPRVQQEEIELTAKVQHDLAALGEKMPGKGKEDELFDRLNIRRQDYHGYAFRRKSLTEELHALAEKEATCRANIKVCDDKLERLQGGLRTEETLGLHLALIEKQKLIADKEHLLAQQQAESSSLEQALLEKLQGTQFTTVKQLNESLELMEHQADFERQLAELEQEIDARTVALQQSQADLETEQAHIVSEISLEELAVQLKSLNEKIDIARLEVQRLDQLLQQQKQLQQRYEALCLRLQEQEKIAELCRFEVEQISAEHGMAFRRRVQEKIAGQLLAKTNEVLEKISGRYYLRQRSSEQGLALEIEDTYQGNVRRLPKTLSGGESFVVSLALALGLSELANNGKSVDSLFLDEGFGNLDADTLYTVISTLEGLHTHGKTVGVISHVEGVQKRFKAQLQVVKKPNGMGELRKAS
jgi:exonuclease SbcC